METKIRINPTYTLAHRLELALITMVLFWHSWQGYDPRKCKIQYFNSYTVSRMALRVRAVLERSWARWQRYNGPSRPSAMLRQQKHKWPRNHKVIPSLTNILTSSTSGGPHLYAFTDRKNRKINGMFMVIVGGLILFFSFWVPGKHPGWHSLWDTLHFDQKGWSLAGPSIQYFDWSGAYPKANVTLGVSRGFREGRTRWGSFFL